MKLSKVTITGADDSIKPHELTYLSTEYPYVEWAILLSRKQEGGNRFPSLKWIEELDSITYDKNINLSGHICGSWVREILTGYSSFVTERPTIYEMFNRFQLNFHAENLEYGEIAFTKAVVELGKGREVILQNDGVNGFLIDLCMQHKLYIAALHDGSHGAGSLPKFWPNYIDGINNGYAGGLSADNVKEELEKIAEIVGDKEIWIDVETRVRSNNDQQFDLDKVEQFLINCKDWVK